MAISLRDKVWSPYLAGAIIGLLQIPAFLLIKSPIGASTSFVTVSGSLAAHVDPGIAHNAYFAKLTAAIPKNWWEVALVVGIAIGAFLSRHLSGTRRHAISPIWRRASPATGAHPRLRYGLAFAAGFIMLFGARLADGCTSGHGLSGIAQLSVGSAIAVASMFAGGIVVARLFLRRI
jgi:uncharacterized protein